MSLNLVTLLYLVASVCFIQALKGLSHPTTSIRGNVFGMVGMAIAVFTTGALILKISGGAFAGMGWVPGQALPRISYQSDASLRRVDEKFRAIKEEAARLDRSLSWVVQRAWKLARTEIKKLPSVNDVADDDEVE